MINITSRFMKRSFSHILLITWILLLISCRTAWVQKSYTSQNTDVGPSILVVDSQVVRMILPYKNILEKDMNRVISVSAYDMPKDKPESRLTNFLADLMLSVGIRNAKEKQLGFVPDVSFTNYGGIRAPLPKGDITVRNVFELMPFENEIVYLKLSGAQLQQLFDQIAAKGGDSVGGVRFIIADKKAQNITINGRALEPEKSYWLATNDYVAQGGDGLKILTQNEKIIFSGLKIRDFIISELEKNYNHELKVELDGRIKYE